MESFIKIGKRILLALIGLILILSIDLSSIMPSAALQIIIQSLAKWLNFHSSNVFLLITILLFLYFLSDIITYFQQQSSEKSAVTNLINIQSKSFNEINEKCEDLNIKLIHTENACKVATLEIKGAIQSHKMHLHDCFIMVNQSYENNLSKYHRSVGKLYKIASSTTLSMQRPIKDLLDKYRNVN